VLFTRIGAMPYKTIVQSLNRGSARNCSQGFSRYLPTGHIVYAVENDLFVSAFDLDRLEAIAGRFPWSKCFTGRRPLLNMTFPIREHLFILLEQARPRRKHSRMGGPERKEERIAAKPMPTLIQNVSGWSAAGIDRLSNGNQADVWIWILT